MSEEEKPKLTFFILSKASQDPILDFQQLLLELKEGWLLNIIQSSDSQASISNNMGYASEIALVDGSRVIENQEFPFAAKLIINPEDGATFNALRVVLWRSRVDYKLYSEKHSCFIPKNPELIVDEVGKYNQETHKALAQFGLTPLYFFQKTKHYYALKKDNSVAIVNPYLLNFIYKKEIPEKDLAELSYVVAPNLNFFAGMFDKGLIPTKFYEYYGKSFKIINESHFDLLNPGRKVFVKPLILEFNQETDEFYTYASDNSSSLLLMDKIRPGETLDAAILRILKEDLKIADDYLGAFVSENVEFDRDKEGMMTPRLIVVIYVDKIKNKDWAKKMSQTSWRSLDGNLASTPKQD